MTLQISLRQSCLIVVVLCYHGFPAHPHISGREIVGEYELSPIRHIPLIYPTLAPNILTTARLPLLLNGADPKRIAKGQGQGEQLQWLYRCLGYGEEAFNIQIAPQSAIMAISNKS